MGGLCFTYLYLVVEERVKAVITSHPQILWESKTFFSLALRGELKRQKTLLDTYFMHPIVPNPTLYTLLTTLHQKQSKKWGNGFILKGWILWQGERSFFQGWKAYFLFVSRKKGPSRTAAILIQDLSGVMQLLRNREIYHEICLFFTIHQLNLLTCANPGKCSSQSPSECSKTCRCSGERIYFYLL